MIITRRALEDLVAHAQAEQPNECCGILIGSDITIHSTIRGRNLAESPARFLLDPRDHIEARRWARANHADVLGFYHSHPYSQAKPSATDIAETTYPECVALIVSLAGTRPETRAFRIRNGVVGEVELVVAP